MYFWTTPFPGQPVPVARWGGRIKFHLFNALLNHAASRLGPAWIVVHQSKRSSHSRLIFGANSISCVPAHGLAGDCLKLKLLNAQQIISGSRPPRTYKDPRCLRTSPHHYPTLRLLCRAIHIPLTHPSLHPSNPHRYHAVQQGFQGPFPVLHQARDWPSPDAGVIAN